MIDHDLPIIRDNGFCAALKGEICKGARDIYIAMDGHKTLGNVFVNGMKFDKSGLVEAAVTFCFNEEDKKMSKFKVGDKVRVRKDLKIGKRYGKDTFVSRMKPWLGREVTISRVCDDGDCYRILGAQWWWTDEMLEPIDDYKIVITSDGEITLARLYDGKKVIRTAQSKCAPDDEFSFEIGANIAFGRLVKPEAVEEKPEYFEGRAVCVESYSSHPWTVGKSYIFASGRTKADDGRVLPELLAAFKEDELSDITLIGARFVPLIMEDKTC